MSVLVMAQVFKRYPNGGCEMLLALALADHADDDGENIYPSIQSLALKTRQSERTVQRAIKTMIKSGWLIPVWLNVGGRGKTSEYKINPDWLKGDNLSPINIVDNSKERVTSTTERVTSKTLKGDIAVSPESSITIINHQESSQQPCGNLLDTLKDSGVIVSLQSEIYRKWVEQKLSLELTVQAIEFARLYKPSPQPIPASYLDRVLKTLAVKNTKKLPWFISNSGLEDMASKLKMRKGVDEIWHDFFQRIRLVAGVTEAEVEGARKIWELANA
ncbi:MAG: helix-turn-helix domain-containing protein [Methylophilaceae bacterium]